MDKGGLHIVVKNGFLIDLSLYGGGFGLVADPDFKSGVRWRPRLRCVRFAHAPAIYIRII